MLFERGDCTGAVAEYRAETVIVEGAPGFATSSSADQDLMQLAIAAHEDAGDILKAGDANGARAEYERALAIASRPGFEADRSKLENKVATCCGGSAGP